MSEISTTDAPKQQPKPMDSTPLIVDPPQAPTPTCTKLLAYLAGFFAATVFMAMLVLPSFALQTTDHAWGDATGPDGVRISLGWKKGVARGIHPVEFESDGEVLLVWSRVDGEEPHEFGSSTPGWEGVFNAGGAVAVMVIVALSSPLFLFVFVPFATKKALRGAASWTDACGATVCLVTQLIWLGFGAAILATTLLFASRAERAVRNVGEKGVEVLCQGKVVCGPMHRPEECGVCSFGDSSQGVKCQGFSEICELELVDEQDGLDMDFSTSASMWILGAEGVMLMGAGLGVMGAFVWVACKRTGRKEFEGLPESAL